MSIEEKQDFPTSQDFNSIEYPKDEKEVSNFIKKFYKSNTPIEIIGSGSKTKLGKPVQSAKTLNLSKISGIIEYLPEELYIKVKAGTPIKEIEEKLKKNKQQLAFEPIDFGYFLDGKSNYGTAAGHVSCNISGPRRFKSGSIRDHVLGFRGINGKGEIIKSGGKVVKNVTGYDLSKLVCGSYGTLIALTEITFKVLPAPEESKTLVIHNLGIDSASEYLTKAISSSNEVSGASFLPIYPLCKKCEMNIENTFSICSISKLFTSVAIMKLVEEGKIKLEDPINTLLPWFDLNQQFKDSPPLTIKSILSHSSGLPRESNHPYWSWPDFPFPSKEDVVKELKNQEMLYKIEYTF